ncbi:DNA-binding death effector domain-containing protein 2 isoform X1 [Amblyraja radiata]|uniref:DNA-binding death effector domain-containing protein 2 isoform X1 n=1 Tax=Amblyraja radiata TaxID=386614 RepID=UPI001402E73E|nr:DNA-binding death effector domain-containing protein 2 isoform X1 [Amblyraja radiata]
MAAARETTTTTTTGRFGRRRRQSAPVSDGAAKRARWRQEQEEREEEEEEAAYCHMVSLHQMFQLVGSQLSQADVDAMSFLLDEAYPPALGPGPLDTPHRHHHRHSPARPTSCSGVRLLYQLERRGLCDEASLGPLLQLLRVITRHDLLPYVGQRRPRAVSPERCDQARWVSGTTDRMESCLNSEQADSTRRNWESGTSSNRPQSVGHGRGRGRAAGKRRGRRSNVPYNQEATDEQSPQLPKATCDIRLRVRAVFSDQHSVLRGNVASVKAEPLDRCFDLFGQANTILKSRDLGSIICDIKFSELSYLDAFWNDYINGSLLEALKGVFITDSLKQAVGQEVIQLLVNVDEDDYEEGRQILLQNVSP